MPCPYEAGHPCCRARHAVPLRTTEKDHREPLDDPFRLPPASPPPASQTTSLLYKLEAGGRRRRWAVAMHAFAAGSVWSTVAFHHFLRLHLLFRRQQSKQLRVEPHVVNHLVGH